jgi:Monooxygenase af470-like
MPKMVKELMSGPQPGLLARPRTFVFGRTNLPAQYWRSFELLDEYARRADRTHLAAWRRFNRVVRDNGSVGVFHETYRVGPGTAEPFHRNVPTMGTAAATAAPGGTRRPVGGEADGDHRQRRGRRRTVLTAWSEEAHRVHS